MTKELTSAMINVCLEGKNVASNSVMIHKLQTALNLKGLRIMYTTSQFYSDKQNRPITVYHIKQAEWDDDKQRYQNVELFKSTSQIQIVLFLRDMWYSVNGKEIPKDNEVWNNIKAKENNYG